MNFQINFIVTQAAGAYCAADCERELLPAGRRRHLD